MPVNPFSAFRETVTGEVVAPTSVATAAGAAVILKSAVGGVVEGDEEPHPVRRQKQQLEIKRKKDCFKMLPQDRIRDLRYDSHLRSNQLSETCNLRQRQVQQLSLTSCANHRGNPSWLAAFFCGRTPASLPGSEKVPCSKLTLAQPDDTRIWPPPVGSASRVDSGASHAS